MGLVLQCVWGSRSQQIDFWPSPYCEHSAVSEADGLWEIFIHIDRGGWWVCYKRSSSNSSGPWNASKYQSAIGGQGARVRRPPCECQEDSKTIFQEGRQNCVRFLRTRFSRNESFRLRLASENSAYICWNTLQGSCYRGQFRETERGGRKETREREKKKKKKKGWSCWGEMSSLAGGAVLEGLPTANMPWRVGKGNDNSVCCHFINDSAPTGYFSASNFHTIRQSLLYWLCTL